ncbi:hypothetical protein M378DRAFT_7215 [Amanita muscaria Koide BX008]|uniref:RRM domain-containing protein n=1 Tax=Amanita muscaria (strain Koide BX008) TaxID=946122 RepID=A0A0C2TSS1_AMAMK|nr:hypothetical protein M378DRAFT_7215 [Amanita muscaria Koide BX008]
MNVVKEIDRINQRELDLGVQGASWHDDYKDSAYIFIGGLHYDLTEGDVITMFSQYGEVMDINLPREKETGKTKGFGFLMYEDQRSTVLAVDNLNGAKVLDKTLRVDHVKNYKQPKVKGEDGEWAEPEDQSLNAKPELIVDDADASEESDESAISIDPEDPMRDYLLAKRREEKELKKKKTKSKGKHKDETPEERAARKARKRAKKEKKMKKMKSEGMKGVEELLKSLDQRPVEPSHDKVPSSRTRDHDRHSHDGPHGPYDRARSRSRTPTYERRDRSSSRSRVQRGISWERSRSPNDGRYARRAYHSRSRSPYSNGRVRTAHMTSEDEDLGHRHPRRH